MTTTTNFGLPIYGNSDKPKWTDTNEAFQDLDNKVADKTADNAFTGTNAFNADLLMKGGSTIESDDGVITPTAPSTDKTGTDVIQINDSAGNPLYRLRPIQHSNGNVDLDIAGQPAANGGVLTFNGEEVGGKHVYSTDEQVVGKWIDGSLLYEKTVSFNLSGSENTIKSLSSLGIPTTGDKVRFITASLLVDGGLAIINIPCYFTSVAYGSIYITTNTNDLVFTVGSQYRLTSNVCTAVLQYIK